MPELRNRPIACKTPIILLVFACDLRMPSLDDYIEKKLMAGFSIFTREEALAALPLKPDGFTAALTRQISKKRLANPRHGFYIILRSKDRIAGALDRSVGSISVLIAGYPSYAPPRCTARRTRPPLDRRVSGSYPFKSNRTSPEAHVIFKREPMPNELTGHPVISPKASLSCFGRCVTCRHQISISLSAAISVSIRAFAAITHYRGRCLRLALSGL